MRIMVLGLRGIPDVQGGVETHALHLYSALAQMGCDVELIVRTPFVPASRRNHGPIRLTRIWSPRIAGLEALLHSFLGLAYAAFARPELLHVHAIGPAIIAPFARAVGLRVVVTHHGADYDRAKWGAFARGVLRTGERWGMRFANARIVISRGIAASVRALFELDSDLIPNGVQPVIPSQKTDALARFGLTPGRYFLQVSRLVPEKRQLDLIRAFTKGGMGDWKLALAGELDASAYSKDIKALAAETGVVLTDFISGEPLAQLYSHAGAFVLPSAHEGLPIAILEALSYGVPVIASDIPANLEIELPAQSYFPLGDIDALAQRMRMAVLTQESGAIRDARRASVTARYDWDRIAKSTLAVYQRVLGNAHQPA